MKKTFIFIAAATILFGGTLQSCYYGGSYGSYFGTMAGSEIGGVIGESIGLMSTSRHGGPGGAMLGRVVGTVAGGVIGNNLGKKADENAANKRAKRKADKKRQNNNAGYYYDNNDGYAYGNDGYSYNSTVTGDNMPVGGYQTEGGAVQADNAGGYYASTNQLVISNLRFEDENGDGKISKYETINVIYELTNKSGQTAYVTLITGNEKDAGFEYSPAHQATVEPGKTIRYKAKVFCKKNMKDGYVDIPVFVNSNGQGSATQTIRVRTGK